MIATVGEAASVRAGLALVKVEETHTAYVEAREVAMGISMEEAINSSTSPLNSPLLLHLSRT